MNTHTHTLNHEWCTLWASTNDYTYEHKRHRHTHIHTRVYMIIHYEIRWSFLILIFFAVASGVDMAALPLCVLMWFLSNISLFLCPRHSILSFFYSLSYFSYYIQLIYCIFFWFSSFLGVSCIYISCSDRKSIQIKWLDWD